MVSHIYIFPLFHYKKKIYIYIVFTLYNYMSHKLIGVKDVGHKSGGGILNYSWFRIIPSRNRLMLLDYQSLVRLVSEKDYFIFSTHTKNVKNSMKIFLNIIFLLFLITYLSSSSEWPPKNKNSIKLTIALPIFLLFVWLILLGGKKVRLLRGHSPANKNFTFFSEM